MGKRTPYRWFRALSMGSGTPSAFGNSPCKGERGMLARQAWVLSLDVNTP